MSVQRNLIQVALFLLSFFCVEKLFANTHIDTLYINKGTMMAVDSTNMTYYAFNSTPQFNKVSKRLMLPLDDTLYLTIINTDSVAHGFALKEQASVSTLIPANGTANVNFSFTTLGAHIYYDPTNNEGYRYAGLGGMVVTTNSSSTAKRFYWNIREHQATFNEILANGQSVNWSNYDPDYFTINGNSNPHVNLDSTARVTGFVGDTILIYIVNTGQSVHSIHFHGYHSKIVQSTKFANHEGRSKDTFAVYSMEVVTLELIPDKPGEYPVHDHNLVAVSGGNMYPNGMFLTMLIQ